MRAVSGYAPMLLRRALCWSLGAGTQAAQYFAKHFPDLPTFQNSMSINRAEWLVMVTTKVCMAHRSSLAWHVHLYILQGPEVRLRLQADRDGRAAEFAAAYAGSELCRANMQLMLGAPGAASASRGGIGRFRAAGGAPVPGSTLGRLTQEDARELATRTETTTSVWWGYRTLIKVPVITA